MTTEKGEGYLKIGNKTIDDLIDNKKIGCKMRVYLLTVRMINGWDQESLSIPVSTYTNRLGIDLRYTKRLLKQLTEENLICRNGSITSIPGDYIQWWWSGKNLPPPGSGKIFSKGGYKVTTETVVKKDTLNTPTLQVNTPGVYATQLSEKEINALEGPEWFRAAMFWSRGFEIDFIEKVLKEYGFNKCMSCWYIFIEATNIKNKTGFFFSLLEKYQEEE
ncbi:hypothetical protein ES705_39857 [subsurface metagenome]